MGIERLRMLLGVVLLSTSASLWAEGWPTTDFEVLVVNERNQRVNWGVGGPLEQVLASWGIELAELETEFPEATRNEIERLLDDSAELLEAWGFPPPDLRAPGRSGGVYRAFIVDGLDVSGRFHPTSCLRFADPMILLNVRDILSGGELRESGRYVVTHELIHAVQFNMPFFDTPCSSGSAGAWITEGTAAAMGWDLVRLLHPPEPPVRRQVWGPRSYSRPLPVPRPLRELSTAAASVTPDPYETSSFWRYLAELYYTRRNGLSDPGVEATAPFDYRYLNTLFRLPPPERDCDEPGDSCLSELRWLN